MATISYGFGGTNVVSGQRRDGRSAMGSRFPSNPAGTRHVAVWSSNAVDAGVRDACSRGVTPRSDEFAVSPPAPSWQSDAGVAALADGRFIVTYTDTRTTPAATSAHACSIPTACPPAASISSSPTDLDQSDVAALAGGGYVVGWTRHNAGGNGDIYRNVYNADGSASSWRRLNRPGECKPRFGRRTCRRRTRLRLAGVARGRRRHRGPFPPLRRHGSGARCFVRRDRHQRQRQPGHPGRGAAGRRFRRRLSRTTAGATAPTSRRTFTTPTARRAPGRATSTGRRTAEARPGTRSIRLSRCCRTGSSSSDGTTATPS